MSLGVVSYSSPSWEWTTTRSAPAARADFAAFVMAPTSLSDTEYPVGSSRPLRSMVVEIWATVTVRPPRSSS